MRISDWSSDVCSSDLLLTRVHLSPASNFSLSFAATWTAPNPDTTCSRCSYPRLNPKGKDKSGRTSGDTRLAIPGSRNAAWIIDLNSSEKSLVGKECVSTFRSWWSPYSYKKYYYF